MKGKKMKKITDTHKTIKETASILNVAESTIYKYFREDKLKSHKVGGRTYISIIEIERFMGIEPETKQEE